MRVVLIGRPRSRDTLRASLPAAIDIVGEAETMADARALAAADVAAFIVAPADASAGRPTRRDPGDVPEEALTPREYDVLELVAEGLSNKAIGARLGISDQTVKFHVASICAKLGVANRTEAVRRALRRGLITL
jgi:DNA-binding CsgD family transcriptional regulator